MMMHIIWRAIEGVDFALAYKDGHLTRAFNLSDPAIVKEVQPDEIKQKIPTGTNIICSREQATALDEVMHLRIPI